jgi:hypothetical protein
MVSSAKRHAECVANPPPRAEGGSMENITPPGTPAKRALAVLDQTPAPAEPGPPKRISKKVRAAIDAMVSGDCKKITEAAAKVGLARESLSRALSTPHIADHLRQKVIRHLAIAASRAGAVKVDLLDSPSEIARDRASSFVLGLAGIAPAATPSVALNLEIRAGYVIDLRSDDPADTMRIVSPTAAPPAIGHARDDTPPTRTISHE